MNYKCIMPALLISLLSPSLIKAESGVEGCGTGKNWISLNGSLQSDILLPEVDNDINTGDYDTDILTNTYLNLNLSSKHLGAGARLEYLDYPLPGFERDFAGWGVPNFYVNGNYKGVSVTAGDFYDQFGCGFIFRTYEERSLGIDNSLRGGRIAINSIPGVRLKALAGKQRRYWEHNDALVYGGDLELNIDRWIKKLKESDTYIMLGGSWVSKKEDDQLIPFIEDGQLMKLNLPETVGAYDVRAQIQKGGYNFLVEYAQKSNDPSADNGYIYKKGEAFLFSGSYSKRGMSALVQAKRSDNMSFRSRRDMQLSSSFINHLPAFAMQHTYSLATIYPYSTQPDGEWAFQGEFAYNFKRKTALGGKYGTLLKMHFSHIRSIEKEYVDATDLKGTDGYKSKFFEIGDDMYYQDFNISLDKKISKDFKVNAMYMYQRFDPVVLGHHEDMVNSHIFIAEGKYNVNDKVAIRAELQYLKASKYKEEVDENGDVIYVEPMDRTNQGDWMFGLVEVSVLPYMMFTVSDMYNNGSTGLHYYMASATFTHGSHRLMAGYGRTRAGYNCSGGVCRMVPASKGFQLSYNFNF